MALATTICNTASSYKKLPLPCFFEYKKSPASQYIFILIEKKLSTFRLLSVFLKNFYW
jgi:hypothetical protein